MTATLPPTRLLGHLLVQRGIYTNNYLATFDFLTRGWREFLVQGIKASIFP